MIIKTRDELLTGPPSAQFLKYNPMNTMSGFASCPLIQQQDHIKDLMFELESSFEHLNDYLPFGGEYDKIINDIINLNLLINKQFTKDK